MKKITYALASLLTFIALVVPLTVVAQSGSNLQGAAPSSGFVDKNGKPLSDEEYAAIRAEAEKGIFEKQPVASAAVVLAVVGGIVLFIKKKKA